MFQEFQNLDSGCINRAQQACFKPPLQFIYLEGTVLMQPLDPVLLNSSAMADPQTLISCQGVEDTFSSVLSLFSQWHQCYGLFFYEFPSTCSVLWFPLHQELAYFRLNQCIQGFVNRAKGKGMQGGQISVLMWKGLFWREGNVKVRGLWYVWGGIDCLASLNALLSARLPAHDVSGI